MSIDLFRACFPKTSRNKKSKSQSIRHYIALEFANKEGKKWISTNRSVHDNIPVQLNPEETEAWRLERLENTPMWSFYILSDDEKKMYISYNDDNDDVTLEYEDDITSANGKRRNFRMFLHADGGILLRDENTYDRYLDDVDGKLQMVTADIPTNILTWFLSPSFELIDAVIESFTIQIHPVSASQKWVSMGATMNNPIQTQQMSEDQNWLMSIVGLNTVEFSVGDLWATSGLLFGSNSEIFNINPYGGGVSLQSTSSSDSEFIKSPDDNGDIYYVHDERDATAWDLEIMSLYLRNKDEIIIFPSFPIRNTKAQKK